MQEFCRVRPKMAFPHIPAFPHNPLLHAALFFNKAQADYFAFQICLHASHPPIHRLCQSQIPSALIRRFTPSSPPQEISKASSEWNAGCDENHTPAPWKWQNPQQNQALVSLTWKKRFPTSRARWRDATGSSGFIIYTILSIIYYII